MEFAEQKKMLTDTLRRGDRQQIANRAGVSRVTLLNATKKCCVSDMTTTEKLAWEECMKFIAEREVANNAIERKMLKLAEKL